MKIWDSMVIVCGMKRQCVVWFSGCGMKGQCVEEAADNHQRFPSLPPFLSSSPYLTITIPRRQKYSLFPYDSQTYGVPGSDSILLDWSRFGIDTDISS